MNRKIVPLALLSFVNMLGFTILLPVLPFIVRQYGQSDVVYGLLLSSYALFQFVGAPLLGSLSDRRGRRPILLLSQAGTVLSWLVFAVAYFLPGSLLPILTIAFARVLDGITGGNVSVANAYLSDITTPEERTRAFGAIGGATGLAMIVGPSLGSFSNSTEIGYLGTVLLAAAISIVTLLIMTLYLHESLPPEARTTDAPVSPLRQLDLLRKIRVVEPKAPLRRLFALRFLYTFAFTSFTSVIILYYIDLFAFDERQLGLLLLFVGSFLVFNQTVVLPRVQRRLGDARTLVLGLTLMTFGMLAMSLVGSLVLLVSFYYFLNLGLSLVMPTVSSLLSQRAGRRQSGEVLGIDASIASACAAIAPPLAGYIYVQLYGGALAVFAAILGVAVVVSLLPMRGPVPSERGSAAREEDPTADATPTDVLTERPNAAT